MQLSIINCRMSASVYPQFLQHIHVQGLYVEGYNYEEMYNIMVNNLINNFIPSFCFIYSYDQINELYDYLDNLLHSTNEDNEDNEPIQNQTNQTNQMNDHDSDIESIYSDSDPDPDHASNEIQTYAEPHIAQTAQTAQTQTAQQMLTAYLANMIPHTYTNIIYYDNTTNYTNSNENLSNIYITYLNNATNSNNSN